MKSTQSNPGFKVQEDGQVARSTKTKTVTEARQLSEQLRKLLKDRGAHQEVLRHCRPQLLKNDYYEAVFESIKGLGDRLREMGFGRSRRSGIGAAFARFKKSRPLENSQYIEGVYVPPNYPLLDLSDLSYLDLFQFDTSRQDAYRASSS